MEFLKLGCAFALACFILVVIAVTGAYDNEDRDDMPPPGVSS